MNDKEFEEKIRMGLHYMEYRAYLYFYYFPEEANKDEITKKAFEHTKKTALKFISKVNKVKDEAMCEVLLEMACEREKEDLFKDLEIYKSDAEYMIRFTSNTVSYLKPKT